MINQETFVGATTVGIAAALAGLEELAALDHEIDSVRFYVLLGLGEIKARRLKRRLKKGVAVATGERQVDLVLDVLVLLVSIVNFLKRNLEKLHLDIEVPTAYREKKRCYGRYGLGVRYNSTAAHLGTQWRSGPDLRDGVKLVCE